MYTYLTRDSPVFYRGVNTSINHLYGCKIRVHLTEVSDQEIVIVIQWRWRNYVYNIMKIYGLSRWGW